VPAHASGNEGIIIRPYKLYPVIEGFENRPPLRIRWNNDDRAFMVISPTARYDYDAWFWAASKWNAILKDAENEYWEQLKPGRPLSQSTFPPTSSCTGGFPCTTTE
jgi:trimethyllysine dioxygenase